MDSCPKFLSAYETSVLFGTVSDLISLFLLPFPTLPENSRAFPSGGHGDAVSPLKPHLSLA
uniref:Uncharacterized protein n=1 Tax=Arundo donax TaxID=35708 RepID=A0A0A9G6Z5_ARUDO